jgi:formate/nitrite transporter FocA (FNT family)
MLIGFIYIFCVKNNLFVSNISLCTFSSRRKRKKTRVLMTLDLVVWAPEAFISFCLLVLLWYGSGSLVSPVAERICFISVEENNTNWPSF